TTVTLRAWRALISLTAVTITALVLGSSRARPSANRTTPSGPAAARAPAAGLAATPPPPTRAVKPLAVEAPEPLAAAGAVAPGAVAAGAVAAGAVAGGAWAAVDEAGVDAAGVLATLRCLLESPADSSAINNPISASPITAAHNHQRPRLRRCGRPVATAPAAGRRARGAAPV